MPSPYEKFGFCFYGEVRMLPLFYSICVHQVKRHNDEITLYRRQGQLLTHKTPGERRIKVTTTSYGVALVLT